MPKIRHLAIKTKHPAKLAEFYTQVFDMKIIHSEKSGSVFLSDGYLTLAILRNRGEAAPSGFNHFGFQVEDLEEIEKRLEKFGEPMEARPATRPYAEYRGCDIEGNWFDLSQHGFEEVETGFDRAEKAAREKAKVTA